MCIRAWIVAPLMIWATTAVAEPNVRHTLDLSFGDDSARFVYEGQLSRTATGPMLVDVGYLFGDETGDLGHVGLKVKGDVGAQYLQVEAALGGTLFWAQPDEVDEDGGALALTGEVYIVPPQATRLRIVGELHYAPSVLSFNGADEFYEVGARVEYEVLQQARVYGGYRVARMEFDDAGSVDLDDGFHVGLNISF